MLLKVLCKQKQTTVRGLAYCKIGDSGSICVLVKSNKLLLFKDTIPYNHQDTLELPKFTDYENTKLRESDETEFSIIAGNATRNMLFAVNCKDQAILEICLALKSEQNPYHHYSTSYVPYTLSVGSRTNTLMSTAKQKPNDTSGSLLYVHEIDPYDHTQKSCLRALKEIPLPEDLHVEQVLETARGLFYIVCSCRDREGNRVVELDEKGTELNEYALFGILRPTDAVLYADDQMLIADNENENVVLLNARHQRERTVLYTTRDILDNPSRLCYIEKNNLLVVGMQDAEYGLAIYEWPPKQQTLRHPAQMHCSPRNRDERL